MLYIHRDVQFAVTLAVQAETLHP